MKNARLSAILLHQIRNNIFRGRTKLVLSAIAFIILLFEGLSYVFFKVTKEHIQPYLNVDTADFLEKGDHARIQSYLKHKYDPTLGWVFPPHYSRRFKNAAGEEYQVSTNAEQGRTNNNSGESTIASFGNSWTFGDEVSDHETWQIELSRLTDTNVDNFGVSGYGTDQAILWLKRKLEVGLSPKVVILGIPPENLLRTANVYMPYYALRSEQMPGFKPIFRETSSGFEWALPHIPPNSSVEEFISAVQSVRHLDHFFVSNNRLPKAQFPYSKAAFDLARVVFEVKVRKNRTWLRFGGGLTALWSHPPARRRMRALLRIFTDLSAEYDFLPVVVVFPTDDFPSERIHSRFFTELTNAQDTGRLQVVDLDRIETPAGFRVPGSGHPSAGGALFIARRLHNALWENAAYRAALGPAPTPSSDRYPISSRCRKPIFRLNKDTVSTLNIGQMNEVVWRDGALHINSEGNPIIEFPRLPARTKGVSIEIEADREDHMFFYTSTTPHVFHSSPSVADLYVGSNEVNLSVRTEREENFARLDPGMVGGDYVIRRLIVFGPCDVPSGS